MSDTTNTDTAPDAVKTKPKKDQAAKDAKAAKKAAKEATARDNAALDERGATIVLPEFEARLAAAANSADQDLIDDVTEEYHAARRDEVKAQDRRSARRRDRESK